MKTLRAKLLRWLLGGVAVLAIIGAGMYAKGEYIVLGAEGYIFGYPLVIMDATRANAALTVGPENQLRRVRQFPDASVPGGPIAITGG